MFAFHCRYVKSGTTRRENSIQMASRHLPERVVLHGVALRAVFRLVLLDDVGSILRLQGLQRREQHQMRLQCQESLVAFVADGAGEQCLDLAFACAAQHILLVVRDGILDMDILNIGAQQLPALFRILAALHKIRKVECRAEMRAGQRFKMTLQRAPVSP